MGMEIHELDQASRRLLLLSSRGTWSHEQQDRAVQLAAQVGDWNAFCDVAIRSFGASLAYRRLSTLTDGGVPAFVLARCHQELRTVALRSLRIEAAMLDLGASCLAPLGIRHVFFKGAALAHRYHADAVARPSRDVDVLVEPGTALQVVRHLFRAGFAPARPIVRTERDLDRWMKRETVYGMRSPGGVLIEVHQSLDHGAGLLDSARMLARAETIDFRGHPLPVLRTADLFVYMCMHHTRHFWSHLHWYADLDAIIAHPLFDLDEVRAVADGARLTATVDACLALNAFARSGDWPETLSLDRGASEALLARSIECLQGGPDHEVRLRKFRLSPDRAFAWQSSMPERAVLFVQRVRHRLRKRFQRVVGWLARQARRPSDALGNTGAGTRADGDGPR